MTDADFHQWVQTKLSTKVLQALLEKRRPQRMLILSDVRAACVPLAPVSPLQIISLVNDETAVGVPLRCRLHALPFAPDVFDLVFLQHLVSDGNQAVLHEALRVLAPGGELLISGLNINGLRFRLGNKSERFPGLRLNRIIHQLKNESFTIVHCTRLGLAGMAWPEITDSQHGLALPFADYVVLHAHHQPGMAAGNILRFKKVQPATVVSATLDVCSNRAASL